MSAKYQEATSITDGGSVSGDRKLKESAPRLAPGRPQPPTMGFDNRAADREAHAHAAGLCGVEGIENAIELFRMDARPGIVHRHKDTCVVLLGADQQVSRRCLNRAHG